MNLNYRAKVPVNIKKPTQSAGGFGHTMVVDAQIWATIAYIGKELSAIKRDLSTLSTPKDKDIKKVVGLIEQRFLQIDRETARRIANIDIPEQLDFTPEISKLRTSIKDIASKMQTIAGEVESLKNHVPDVAIEVIREELSADKQQMIAGLKAETKALKATIDELKKELEESAKSETIEDLKHQIQNLSLRVAYNNGGGGGGMGNIKYFRFSGDNATTVFTLPDTPTQEGAAVFVYYNGQRQHPTEHYTVSGRTLTTLFTAETGTYIDGWIIT